MISRFPRSFAVALCLVVGALGAGCGALSTFELPNMRTVQTRTFKETSAQVYDASRAALEAMNYTFLRGSRADGRLVMQSRVQPSATLRPRQRHADITIKSLDTGETELGLAFWEASEDESAGGTVTATNRILRDSMVYQVFWEHLAEALGHPPPAPPAGEP